MAPSFWQILIILVIILIIFGVGKLPKVMGDLGKGIKAFKQGLNEDSEPEDKSSQKDESKLIEKK